MTVSEHIVVSKAVKAAIAAQGVAGESYNTVLKRILNIESEQDPKNVEKKLQKNLHGARTERPERQADETPTARISDHNV